MCEGEESHRSADDGPQGRAVRPAQVSVEEVEGGGASPDGAGPVRGGGGDPGRDGEEMFPRE